MLPIRRDLCCKESLGILGQPTHSSGGGGGVMWGEGVGGVGMWGEGVGGVGQSNHRPDTKLV